MVAAQRTEQVVFTHKARCRDCYRCLRQCPVKAIRMHEGQAYVIDHLCISCGTCIRECPQHAKAFRQDIDRARDLLASKAFVAVSLAPAYVSLYSDWERQRLPSALRKLGFAWLEETAVGAWYVAQQTAEVVRKGAGRGPNVCTACPAVVSYVEQYHPDLVKRLVPVASPMIAHARRIKAQRPEAKVVFIGPCVAKKSEAERPEYAGLVDCVLTFSELQWWLEQEKINLSNLEESGFDEQPRGDARLFPLEGGLARTAALSTDQLSLEVLAVSGVEELVPALESLRQGDRPVLLEPLFCAQGCVNGPAIPSERNVYTRRLELLRHAKAHPGQPAERPLQLLAEGPSLDARFSGTRDTDSRPITEEAIRRILRQTGKANPEDQLNCGACGYASCREKAVAVIKGMAETEMCIPHMRRLAEQRTDRIIATSPNGIVILDERLNIISMNDAFKRYFRCHDGLAGKRISHLMDPEHFERLAADEESLVEVTVRHERFDLICHQLLYPLRDERQYVGIFVNITHSQSSQKKLDQLRADTIRQAEELLEHQIQMAQRLAQYLGESTARGEQLVKNLQKVVIDRSEEGGEGGWPWDMSTSK